MDKTKFLVYLDILGFGPLATQIDSEKGIDPRIVRDRFIEVIKEKIGALEAKERIIGQKYGNSDDWILVTDTLDKVFSCIYEILEHNTGYLGYEKIPLEIAIGMGEFDKWARFDGKNLVREDSAIDFLKTNIIGYYREWFQKNQNQSPKSTFIILTEQAYQELEPLDKKICQQIKRDSGKGKIITFFSADVAKVTLRGKAYEFTGKIGYPSHKWYGRIEELYIPPLEYEDIKKTLKERRIVFITGSQEYGKTYTAVRLMWEYYNEGYEPYWIEGGEESERNEVRKRLENIRTELKPGHIIYFEDPFGKIKYERREGLEREIGTIIENVKHVEDVYIIITSREEVFKEFEKEKISETEFEAFEQKLNIKKPSYDYKKRKEILFRFAEAENCNWLKSDKLRGIVFESIKDKRILSTPLSIKNFVEVTIDVIEETKLKDKLKEKSKETAKSFAKEIKAMTQDKILFLSFLFVSGHFEIDFIKEIYEELVHELDIKDAIEFDRLLDWFKDDKINIRYPAFNKAYSKGFKSKNIPNVEFSHPSYFEALDDILVEKRHFTKINKNIFSRLLIKLSKKDRAAWPVALTIARNINKLPKNISNLLLTFPEKKRTLSPNIEYNLDKLTNQIKKELLINLSKRDENTFYVTKVIADNFTKLPQNIQTDLMTFLSEKDKSAEQIKKIVLENLDKLPESSKNELLTKLLKVSININKTNRDITIQ